MCLYGKVDEAFEPLLEVSGDEDFSGLCIIKKRGHPLFLEKEGRIVQLDRAVNLLFWPLPGCVFWKSKEYSRLYEELSKKPDQFMMEKILEESSVKVLACYHPHLLQAIADEEDLFEKLLLGGEKIRQKALNSFMWKVSYGFRVRGIIPCTASYKVKEGIWLFERGLISTDGVYHNYYISSHPFYHDFFTLINLDEKKAFYYLEIATEEGIDGTYPLLHMELKKIIEEEISREELVEKMSKFAYRL